MDETNNSSFKIGKRKIIYLDKPVGMLQVKKGEGKTVYNNNYNFTFSFYDICISNNCSSNTGSIYIGVPTIEVVRLLNGCN